MVTQVYTIKSRENAFSSENQLCELKRCEEMINKSTLNAIVCFFFENDHHKFEYLFKFCSQKRKDFNKSISR